MMVKANLYPIAALMRRVANDAAIPVPKYCKLKHDTIPARCTSTAAVSTSRAAFVHGKWAALVVARPIRDGKPNQALKCRAMHQYELPTPVGPDAALGLMRAALITNIFCKCIAGEALYGGLMQSALVIVSGKHFAFVFGSRENGAIGRLSSSHIQHGAAV